MTAPADTDVNARLRKAIDAVLPPESVSREALIADQVHALGPVVGDEAVLDLLVRVVRQHELPYEHVTNCTHEVVTLAAAQLVMSAGGRILPTVAAYAFVEALYPELGPQR